MLGEETFEVETAFSNRLEKSKKQYEEGKVCSLEEAFDKIEKYINMEASEEEALAKIDSM